MNGNSSATPPAGESARRSCRGVATLVLLLMVTLVPGCDDPRSVLDPAAAEARKVGGLWWVFFVTAAVVYALVIVFLAGAIWRARRHPPSELPRPPSLSEPPEPREQRLLRVIGGGVVATVVTLFGLLLSDYATGRALRPPDVQDPLTIRITGQQWWWQIEYEDPSPSKIVQTANELHLPVGRPVKLELRSSDVIHSFWIPNLSGKRDLVPGHPTTHWLTPERPGTYTGQCAEFCGHQHAHMGLVAVVEPPEIFAAWLEAQRQPAASPSSEAERRGQQVFLTSSCVLCHTIGGTPAQSHVGPPLTHLASRQTIAAGSFPNNRGYLAGWILDPHALKPGVRMPQNPLEPDDLHALLDYLQSLK